MREKEVYQRRVQRKTRGDQRRRAQARRKSSNMKSFKKGGKKKVSKQRDRWNKTKGGENTNYKREQRMQ